MIEWAVPVGGNVKWNELVRSRMVYIDRLVSIKCFEHLFRSRPISWARKVSLKITVVYFMFRNGLLLEFYA
jgi:hypothetical protein